MMYNCAICGEQFKSLLVDRKLATTELGPILQKHIQEHHPKDWEDFGKVVGQIPMLACGLASVNRFITYDPEDLESIAEYEKQCDDLMELLGFNDPEDIEAEEIVKKEPRKKKNLLVMPGVVN